MEKQRRMKNAECETSKYFQYFGFHTTNSLRFPGFVVAVVMLDENIDDTHVFFEELFPKETNPHTHKHIFSLKIDEKLPRSDLLKIIIILELSTIQRRRQRKRFWSTGVLSPVFCA